MITVSWNFTKFQPFVATDKFRRAVARGLYIVAEKIMGKAKDLCPVETGALRNSGHVQLPTIDGKHIEVRLGFGGPAARYAIYVHENLTAKHPIGQAKFLEVPLMAAAGDMIETVRGYTKVAATV